MARYRARNGLDILDFKHLVLALFVYTFHKFTLKASEPHFIQDLGVCRGICEWFGIEINRLSHRSFSFAFSRLLESKWIASLSHLCECVIFDWLIIWARHWIEKRWEFGHNAVHCFKFHKTDSPHRSGRCRLISLFSMLNYQMHGSDESHVDQPNVTLSPRIYSLASSKIIHMKLCDFFPFIRFDSKQVWITFGFKANSVWFDSSPYRPYFGCSLSLKP